MPRKPIELNEHQRIDVETLAALLNQEQIADYLGIGRTTFHEIMKRDSEVAERYKRGKAKAIAHVATAWRSCNDARPESDDRVTGKEIGYSLRSRAWRD